MAMTEAEARTKWCPNTRKVVSLDNADRQPMQISSANRTRDDQPICVCIASRCMFWRWDGGSSPRARAGAVAQKPSDKAAAMALDGAPTEGYCGQAGPA